MASKSVNGNAPADPHAALGSGGRFAALKANLAKRGAKSPGGLAAFIGREKYGRGKMSRMAAAGRSRSR